MSKTTERAASGAPFDPVRVGGEIQRRIGVKTSRDEALARLTTMRVGGPADLFTVAHNAFELRALVRFARSRAIPLTLLGRGSDVVIADAGIRGLTVQVRAEGSRIEGERYVAEAGVPMARAATETQRGGLSGLEFGLAIPGTVGGAVWANAGAHESNVAAIVEGVDILRADGSETMLAASSCGFGYRDSRFKHNPEEIIVSAAFELTPATADEIKLRLEDIKRWRQAHQPLGLPSAGSVFRNPPGNVSAGALIDRAGLKGLRVGGATVSEKHANFIVNDRRGSASDVRQLAERVRAEIRRRDGIDLQYEIEFVGDWASWSEEASE